MLRFGQKTCTIFKRMIIEWWIMLVPYHEGEDSVHCTCTSSEFRIRIPCPHKWSRGLLNQVFFMSCNIRLQTF